MSDFISQLRARAVQLAVLALSLVTTAASAQSQTDADLKAIKAYALTMPKYTQYLDATVNMSNVAAKNPQLVERLAGLGNKSLAEQVKLLEAVPPIRGAITATGLTTRDYVLTQGALLLAGMAHMLTKDAKISPDSAIKTSGVSRANLEFYQKNEAEIGRLAKEAEARAPKIPDAEAGGEGEEGAEPAAE